jgi:hypothetical protein
MRALNLFKRILNRSRSPEEDSQPESGSYNILKVTRVLRSNSGLKQTTPELSLPEIVRHAMRRCGMRRIISKVAS